VSIPTSDWKNPAADAEHLDRQNSFFV